MNSVFVIFFAVVANVSGAVGNWSQLIIAMGVAGGASIGAHRYINRHLVTPIKAVPGLVQTVDTLTETVQVLSELVAKQNDQLIGSLEAAQNNGSRLDKIEEQFFNNHGSSLRDSNDRTEAIVKALADHVGIDLKSVVPRQGE